jgi:hypothetical protein
MTRAEQYRLRAKEAEEQASKIHGTQLKEGFLEIGGKHPLTFRALRLEHHR